MREALAETWAMGEPRCPREMYFVVPVLPDAFWYQDQTQPCAWQEDHSASWAMSPDPTVSLKDKSIPPVHFHAIQGEISAGTVWFPSEQGRCAAGGPGIAENFEHQVGEEVRGVTDCPGRQGEEKNCRKCVRNVKPGLAPLGGVPGLTLCLTEENPFSFLFLSSSSFLHCVMPLSSQNTSWSYAKQCEYFLTWMLAGEGLENESHFDLLNLIWYVFAVNNQHITELSQ